MPEAEVLDRPPPLDDARRLAESLARGAQLDPLLIDGLPLVCGEHAYAEVDVGAWRWVAQDVVYERRSMLVGGPMLMAVSALASAAGNRRYRRAAEQAAAPQWHSLGTVRVVATDRRLLVWHEGAWWSVWYRAVAGVHIDADGYGLMLKLRQEAPYRLAGESVPLLVVAVAWLTADSYENPSSKDATVGSAVR